MKPLYAILRLCVLVSLFALGCSSDEEGPASTDNASGGRGGASANSSARTAGGAEVGGTSNAGIAGAAPQAGAAGSPSGSLGVAGAGGSAVGVGGAAGASVGAAGSNSAAAAGGPSGVAGAGQTYTIRGTISGLSGSGLILSLVTGNSTSAGTPLPIGSDGQFSFPLPVAAGSAVIVKVSAQPSGPQQTCSVSAAGTIASLTRDVTDIAVTCQTNSYKIGGSIAGLTGSGLVVANSTGDELTIGKNGNFAFPTRIASGQQFTVTIKKQPLAPSQTCTVAGGSGTILSANVTSVVVNCATNSYVVGGNLSGLVGTGLVLRNNGTDGVTPTGEGSFAFPTPVQSGGAFAVTIETQPTSPNQTCTLKNATGTVANGNVETVTVECTTNTYLVGGKVTGLAGSGLTLQDNLSDNLALVKDGNFTFPLALPSGGSYSVTILAQPTSPSQDCTLTGATGSVVDQNIASVNITCVTRTYAVGGKLAGLAANETIVLSNNGTDSLSLGADGAFAFPAKIASGIGYKVAIQTQPATQFCSLVGGQGVIGSADVTSVTVNCSEHQRSVGGTVVGLAGSGLQLALNEYSPEPISNSGTFAFGDVLAEGSSYTVAIVQQPTHPWQTCKLTNATGIVGQTDITDVTVDCTTDAFAVGGTISGLAGTGLELQNNGADKLASASNGSFVFPAKVESGKPYAVTVRTQPTSPAQTCKVTSGGGTVTGADISNVQIVCTTNPYSIGGTISGLVGSVVIANNSETLKLTGDGQFSFKTMVASGDAYSVSVVTQPASPTQVCTITNGNGTVGSQNVSDVSIACVTSKFSIGGSVMGLAAGKSLTLQNNAGNDLTVTATGPFTFTTPIPSGGTFDVTLLQNPAGQICTVSGGNGTVGSANVTSVSVNCTDLRVISGSVSGLSGSGLVLRNGTEDLNVTAAGTFAFKTLYLDGSTYNVTVQSQPSQPWQTCTLNTGTGSGTVNGDVTTVRVTCSTNPYNVRVDVTGLSGGGLVLQNNSANNLSVSTPGSYVFSNPVLSGQTYNVTVLTQPTTQICSVSAGVGTISNADATLAVNCAPKNFSIGGTVYGYVGTGIKLRNNGGNELSITSTGTFTFTDKVATGSAYAVTVSSQPNGMVCGVTYGSGTVGNANVTNVLVNCPGYLFDADTQGWFFENQPAGYTTTWESSVGTPTLGALKLTMPFKSSGCSQQTIKVQPPTMNATGKTLKMWVRFDTFPNSDKSGSARVFAQDAQWQWNAQELQLNTFQPQTWKQVTLALPAGGNWTSIMAMGLQITPGGANTCQNAVVYIDSVVIE